MPRISQVFPSKHLSAADLNGQEMILTITGADVQGFDDGDKVVLFVEETEKSFVMNKTNCQTVATMYGDDTDEWIGQRITVFSTWVDFQGRQVEAIRVRPKPPRQQKPAPARKAAPPVTQADADMTDSEWEAGRE